MISGVLFFWTSWVFWIIVTFLMKKNKQRTLYALLILFMIIFVNVFISIYQYTASLSLIFLTIFACMLLTKLPRLSYHIVCSFIIAIGYTSILLWEIHTPIWLFLPRTILIPLICTTLIILLTKDFECRIVIGAFSICFGELLFHFILSAHNINLTMGELEFFDLLLVTLFMVFSIHMINVIRLKLNKLAQSYEIKDNDQHKRVFRA